MFPLVELVSLRVVFSIHTDSIAIVNPDITVYPKKYAHGFVVLCFVVVMQSFIMNSHEVFIHIQQGCFAGTGAIVRLLQCQWSKPDGYGKISQCITTTKHSKAKTVCIFLGIYCILEGGQSKHVLHISRRKKYSTAKQIHIATLSKSHFKFIEFVLFWIQISLNGHLYLYFIIVCGCKGHIVLFAVFYNTSTHCCSLQMRTFTYLISRSFRDNFAQHTNKKHNDLNRWSLGLLITNLHGIMR